MRRHIRNAVYYDKEDSVSPIDHLFHEGVVILASGLASTDSYSKTTGQAAPQRYSLDRRELKREGYYLEFSDGLNCAGVHDTVPSLIG